MTEFDWESIRRAKDAHRDKLAALPFDEKLQILERLRERTRVFNGSRHPLSGNERSTASNARMFNLPAQSATGAIRLGVFGANATLVLAATPVETRTSAITTLPNRNEPTR